MVNKSTDDLMNHLLNLRINSVQNKKSPHKYIFLICIIKLYDKDSNRVNKFPLNYEIESLFKQIWLDFFPMDNPQTIFIEYPFYHLLNEGFWHFKIIENKEEDFKIFSHKKKRLTKRRIIETVEFGYFDEEVHALFSDSKKRSSILKDLIRKIKILSEKDSRDNNIEKPSSLFKHEEMAINEIEEAIQPRGLGFLCSNIEIHDPHSNRYFEIDVLIVSKFGIYVVELKHWTGNVEVCPYNWFVNGMTREDPHKGNNFKAKLIKGLCERKYPFLKFPFATSVVVLTHPQVTVENASGPNTQKGQPTFDSINTFVDYLKFQSRTQSELLSNADAKKVRDYIASLHQPGKPRDIQFYGYEIIKKLYQADDREELIARQTNVRARRLTRLRIFFNTVDNRSYAASTLYEKAKATLEAVSKIGNHINILQVWPVPSQEGHLIEGSDWSEQGTLRDMMSKKAPMTLNEALPVISGILSGLEAIHEKMVVHRNLRPENILMVEDIPKLMNFDLSYQMVDERQTVIPDPFQLDRDAYIAPEIYKGNDFDENADLFSLGVIFYEMLTGKKPFKCSLDIEKENEKLTHDCMENLKNLSLPDSVLSMIISLMQSDRRHRPASARLVLEKLAGSPDRRSVAPNRRLHPGDTHDSYEIIDFLKQGSESQLYKARWMLNEEFCLKLFNIDVPQDRINREKKFSASVTHSSIVKAENCLRWDDKRWFIAYKWVDGKPLFPEKPEGLPALATFGEVAQALLKALEALHDFEEDNGKSPILHNDIKPENILLTPDSRPKLIDFGIASNPGTFLYAGTSGYVPPDSFSGDDRDYSVQGDLFGLGVTLFEWFFGTKPFEKLTIDARPKEMKRLREDLNPSLEEWFYKAIAPLSENRFQSARGMREGLETALMPRGEESAVETGLSPPSGLDKAEDSSVLQDAGTEVLTFELPLGSPGNLFVSYLNTLQNLDASSGNALAENQACNEWFGHIQVAHPLANRIYEELRSNKRHVILTGHAGDGKSTIGLEIYRKISGFPSDEPLSRAMRMREDLQIDGNPISIIKDFSEWDDDKRIQVIKDAEKENATPVLLITNTGTLLDAFRRLEQGVSGDWLRLESDWLESFSSPHPKTVNHNNTEFLVINLAMFDDLQLAREIFARMIDEKRWNDCEQCKEHGTCSIRRNVALLQNNPTAVDRMFLIYRRLFEYGERFTLRQLVAHMAYLITAGMEYKEIVEHAKRPLPPPLAEYMFFNRFFGDNGREPDAGALQLKIIRVIRTSEIGKRICPSWERRLWLRDKKTDIDFSIEGMNQGFETMRQIGAGSHTKVTYYQGDEGRKNARRQVRRMLYFLYNPPDGSDTIQTYHTYLSTFLDSPMLLDLVGWRDNPGQFTKKAEIELRQKILHVLQEHFTGTRLPERTSFDSSLYITLNRNIRDVRQSAQIVLADFRVRDFEIGWKVEKEERFMAPSLQFTWKGAHIPAKLNLELSFIDYVMMRHNGEIGQALRTSFSDRLERFKAQLIKQACSSANDNKVMLIRLQTNHTFKEHQVFLDDNKLEVI